MTKEDYKQKRKEEKKREMEEIERREREPPKQYTMVKIKTAVGRYPVMNYLSQFTADEIHEAKRCLLNQMKRPIGAPISPFHSPMKQHRGKHAGNFSLNVQSAAGG